MHNVDDTENQLQLAGSRDCSAVSLNVKVLPRKVSDGACLTLQGRRGGNKRGMVVVLCWHLLGASKGQ